MDNVDNDYDGQARGKTDSLIPCYRSDWLLISAHTLLETANAFIATSIYLTRPVSLHAQLTLPDPCTSPLPLLPPFGSFTTPMLVCCACHRLAKSENLFHAPQQEGGGRERVGDDTPTYSVCYLLLSAPPPPSLPLPLLWAPIPPSHSSRLGRASAATKYLQ